MKVKKPKLTHDEISSLGGRSTLKKHGRQHFVDMINKRHAANKKK